MNCPKCGRFCSNVVATVNGLEQIVHVGGTCSNCGHVDLSSGDWCAEMFERGEEE